VAVPVYKHPVFRQSSPKLDLILNINVLESLPCASPFYPLHSKSSLVKLETPLVLQVLATSSLLVQVILSRPVEALTEVIEDRERGIESTIVGATLKVKVKRGNS